MECYIRVRILHLLTREVGKPEKIMGEWKFVVHHYLRTATSHIGDPGVISNYAFLNIFCVLIIYGDIIRLRFL